MVPGGGFKPSEGMYQGAIANADSERNACNAALGPKVMAYAANKALEKLGLHYAGGNGTSEKASIDSSQGADLWKEKAFASGGSIKQFLLERPRAHPLGEDGC